MYLLPGLPLPLGSTCSKGEGPRNMLPVWPRFSVGMNMAPHLFLFFSYS